MRFETDDDLRVLPAELCAALTMAPVLDRYVDCLAAWNSNESAPLFLSPDSSPERAAQETPLAHWFMIGDAALFKPDSTVTNITIELTGAHLEADWFKDWYCWHNGKLSPLTPTVVTAASDGGRMVIELASLPQSDPITLADLQSELCEQAGFSIGDADVELDPADPTVQTPLHWLLVKPADYIRVMPSTSVGYLPKIRTLACAVEAEDCVPQQAAWNGTLLDLTPGAYPFGKRPTVGDAFYIRSDSAFAHPKGVVTLNFTLLSKLENTVGTLLDWQFWGGEQKAWISFVTDTGENPYGLIDTTDHLSQSGAISFRCPTMALPLPTVAGNAGYWIRAMLKGYENLSAFNFQPLAPAITAIPDTLLAGSDKQPVIDYLQQKTGANLLANYKSVPPTNPPFIVSLRIDYSYAAEPAEKWRHNAFRLDSLNAVPWCMPYLPLPDEPSAFYLGFTPQDFTTYCLNERLSLYFDIDGVHMGERIAQSWQWLNVVEQQGGDSLTQQWQSLVVVDDSAGFLRGGRVSFTVPASMQPSILFSRRAYWFRVLGGRPAKRAIAAGVYPNTTGAYNLTTYTGVVIGSSTGVPDQTFLLPYADVHEIQPGETSDERNVGAQPEIELQVLEPSALESKLGPELADHPVPVTWKRVDSFAGCDSMSRVFTLEGRSGAIAFGNGVSGMIPPEGSHNIVAQCFKATHGKNGNVDAGSIRLLFDGIDGIAGVTNVTKAAGGADGDTVADMVRRGPGLLRANDRVITRGDLEIIAEAASARVCRASAIEYTVDSVAKGESLACDKAAVQSLPQMELVVLPMSDYDDLRTAPSFLEDVLTYLKARCPVHLLRRITLRTPVLQPIDVALVISTTEPPPKWKTLQSDIGSRLAGFLHPVTGGPNAKGWPFGQPVPCSLVLEFLRGLAALGVTEVGYLALCGQLYQVKLAADSVPCAGTIDIQVKAA
jgi:hypothetical protein